MKLMLKAHTLFNTRFADSVLEYASALTRLIDSAFGDCENYIEIAGRAAELRWSLLEDPNEWE